MLNKLSKLFFIVLVCFITKDSGALQVCNAASCGEEGETAPIYPYGKVGCSDWSLVAYGGECVATCNTCLSAENRISFSYKPSDCINSVTLYYCESSLETCSVEPYKLSSCTNGTVNETITGCKTYGTNKCFGGYKVRTCSACDTDYTLTGASLDVDGCSNTYSYSRCKKNNSGLVPIGDECETDSDCGTSDLVWKASTVGVNKKTTYTCTLGEITDGIIGFATCSSSTIYTCASGYYSASGYSTSTKSTTLHCTACPEHGFTVSGGGLASIGAPKTNPGGADSITTCYVNNVATFEDDAGVWGFDSNCYYSE